MVVVENLDMVQLEIGVIEEAVRVAEKVLIWVTVEVELVDGGILAVGILEVGAVFMEVVVAVIEERVGLEMN